MPSKSKKKTVKKVVKRNPLKNSIGGPAMLWLMEKTKAWCNEPASRNERTARKKQLGESMQIELQSIKNFYNLGQIKSKHVFQILSAILGLKESELVTFFESIPFLQEKLGTLSAEKKKLITLTSKLSDRETAVVNRLIEVGLEANKVLKNEHQDED